MARISRYEDDYYGFPPYVSVAERKRNAAEKIKKLSGKGEKLSPVIIEGRNIAKTFWGKAWCDNIESYHDYESRLPRGRSYVKNGAVIDLQIEKGKISARVMGSELYEINITIKELHSEKWERIKKDCAGKIASLIDLIQGKLSPEIIELLCRKEDGLFPAPQEIKLICNCLDCADLCKHLAAVLYGVGARLDNEPELFFLLRGVDQKELFSADFANELASGNTNSDIDDSNLGSIFGIELDDADMIDKAEPVKTAVKKIKAPSVKKSKQSAKRKTEKAKPKSSAKKKKTYKRK